MHMDFTCLYCLAFISLALLCGPEGWCTTSGTYVDLSLSTHEARWLKGWRVLVWKLDGVACN
jgi:hypothetical protein